MSTITQIMITTTCFLSPVFYVRFSCEGVTSFPSMQALRLGYMNRNTLAITSGLSLHSNPTYKTPSASKLKLQMIGHKNGAAVYLQAFADWEACQGMPQTLEGTARRDCAISHAGSV